MMFRISPDPRHPLGGHALLSAGDGLSTGNGQLTIRRSYDGRYLGASGWQPARVSLGPLESDSNGLLLGPDVVRHIDEFDNLEISFEGGSTGSVVWPDNVLPPPDAARGGGLGGAWAEPAEDMPVVAADAAEAKRNAEPPLSETPPGSRRGTYLVLALIVVVLAIAAALYLLRDDLAKPRPDETGLECRDGAVSDVTQAGLLLDWVERCANDERVTAHMRLGIVERLVGETPEALIIMGTWYDPGGESGPSPFDRSAIDVAARYYAEAVEAGVDGAQDLLDDVCGRLDADNFMQNEAITLYCGGEQ